LPLSPDYRSSIKTIHRGIFNSRKRKHQIGKITMDTGKAQNVSGTAQHLPSLLPNPWTPPQYETAGARSSRMIIDSASYNTTPSSSPPNERSHVFSAHDCHHKAPDAAALAEADRLQQLLRQQELKCQADSGPAMVPGTKEENVHRERRPFPQGIVPPYMLQAIANSEAAGPQARASAEQTLLSSKAIRDGRSSEGNRGDAGRLKVWNAEASEVTPKSHGL
jgi:hypothetical protein